MGNRQSQMKLNKLQELALKAGAPIIQEEDKTDNVEIHVSPKGFGNLGDIVVMDGGPGAAMIAKLLGVPDGWHKTKVGPKCWAAYNAGDRLTFFGSEMDFEEDEESADIDDMIDDDHPDAAEIKAKLAKRRKE